MTSVRSPGSAAARSARPAGETTFAGASTSSRAALVQRPMSAARSATGARSSPPPQITKRSTPRGRPPLRQRRRLVAADDGAFGQRAHLLLDGDGQRRVERPRDRPAVAARSHRARGSGPQPVGAGLERHDGQRGVGRVHHRDRIGIRHARAPGRPAPPPVRPRRRSDRRPTACGSPAVTSTFICRTLSVNSHTLIGGTMTWVKPKFEIVELCSEVTSYVFHR